MMRRLGKAILTALVLGSFSESANALFAFGEIGVLNSNAATDNNPDVDSRADFFATLRGDGNGNVVAVWRTSDPALGAVEPYDLAVVSSRSTDGGRTWSDLSPIHIPASTYPGSVATLGFAPPGTWIAAWSLESAGGGPFVARSTDAGQTWSLPVDLGSSGMPTLLSAVGDSDGNWVLICTDQQNLFDPMIYFRSTDDGLSWSSEAPFPNLMSASFGSYPYVAKDENGTWIAVWEDQSIYASRSIDGGANWSSPVLLSGVTGASVVAVPRVATDGNGKWTAGWDDGAGRVWVAASADGGQTWEAPVLVFGDPAFPWDAVRNSQFVGYQDGVWNVCWEEAVGPASYGIGTRDSDMVCSRSFDGGATWTDFGALNVNAGTDNNAHNIDGLIEIATATDGSAVLAYLSKNSLSNTIGEDFDIFFARSDDFCPSTPDPSCLTATRPGASSISYKNPLGGRDKLQWKWRYGAETLLSDFGNPSLATDYALCVYDKAGGSVRDVMEAHALAGGNCKKGPCWVATSDGWMYRDSDGRRGPLRSLQLVAGADGSASIRLKASGPALAPPPMPLALDPSMRMQLVNVESGLCWEAEFSTATSNLATEFRATSD